jgi:uncharacterized protein YjbI with pentapeptide repeats
MYKLIKDSLTNEVYSVLKGNSMSIPFDPANTDYADFKKAVAEGAELQDADGNVMSAEAAQEFIRGLP